MKKKKYFCALIITYITGTWVKGCKWIGKAKLAKIQENQGGQI